jgi:hypothetical protein
VAAAFVASRATMAPQIAMHSENFAWFSAFEARVISDWLMWALCSEPNGTDLCATRLWQFNNERRYRPNTTARPADSARPRRERGANKMYRFFQTVFYWRFTLCMLAAIRGTENATNKGGRGSQHR